MAKSKKTAASVKETVETTVAETSAAEATATEATPVQLTIADLQLLGRIVDLASRRGAFQAGELSQVGEAYNKLAGFLSYVDSVQKKEEAEKAAASTDTEETSAA